MPDWYHKSGRRRAVHGTGVAPSEAHRRWTHFNKVIGLRTVESRLVESISSIQAFRNER